ncbi:MAG: hypothetical protein OEM81_10920 [Acidimicrobiia bacterium]|nr:hypothetical protein [Acidimicrobiia bacterium]MDH3398329.1 hypothetical protein [Acidimicrobiia bacterium]
MNPERRAIVSIVAAVSVLVVVTAIILIFGVIPLPDFPSLTEQSDPSIPGTIAYVVHDRASCIYTVPASGGQPAEVWCGQYADVPGWTSDGLLVVTDYFAEPVYVLIDPATGSEVDRVRIGTGSDGGPEPYPYDLRRQRPDGAVVFTDWKGDGASTVRVRFADGTERAILTVENAPRDYNFSDAQWSPDGSRLLISDSAGRLIVAKAEGEANPRVVVRDQETWAYNAAWYIPGNDTYTVDVPGR